MLQIINQLIKDNTDFQENACLVGLVSATCILVLVFFSLSGIVAAFVGLNKVAHLDAWQFHSTFLLIVFLT